MFHPLSHIYAKTPFCCFKTVANKSLNHRHVVLNQLCKRGTHLERSFLIDKCSCKMVNTLPSDIFNSSAISCNFNLRSAKMSLWSFWFYGITEFERRAFSVIYVCTTVFEVSISSFNDCFQWSTVLITLIKPLLCLNSIFSHQEAMLYQHMKFRFFHCFENLQQ